MIWASADTAPSWYPYRQLKHAENVCDAGANLKNQILGPIAAPNDQLPP